jgi:uncharacterized protein YdcH (DUF465 family)
MSITTNEEEAAEFLRKESEEFNRLEKEHRRLDEEIQRFNKRSFFSTEDEIAKKRLQKLKLFTKDKMAEMIRAIKDKD